MYRYQYSKTNLTRDDADDADEITYAEHEDTMPDFPSQQSATKRSIDQSRDRMVKKPLINYSSVFSFTSNSVFQQSIATAIVRIILY